MRVECGQEHCLNRLAWFTSERAALDFMDFTSFARRRGWLVKADGWYCPNHLWVRKTLETLVENLVPVAVPA